MYHHHGLVAVSHCSLLFRSIIETTTINSVLYEREKKHCHLQECVFSGNTVGDNKKGAKDIADLYNGSYIGQTIRMMDRGNKSFTPECLGNPGEGDTSTGEDIQRQDNRE